MLVLLLGASDVAQPASALQSSDRQAGVGEHLMWLSSAFMIRADQCVCRESISICFDDSLTRLEVKSPWSLKQRTL